MTCAGSSTSDPGARRGACRVRRPPQERCGALSVGLRHPELFAVCHARVPIVRYTYLGSGSTRRIEPSCWVGRITPEVLTHEGVPLLDRLVIRRG